MIKILEQEFISEVGQRANNEDNYGFIPKSTFVVCDGVGGSEKGEVASDIVCQSILKSFLEDNKCTVELALPLAESSMAAYLEENQQSLGMATTLTLAHVREDGVYVAWVGDSRVYQFRSGKVHFVTKDHSWVNEALDMGLITQEESINHPKSNIITKAVQGSSKPVKADSKLIQDLLPNDYFLLCSDGVLESWMDKELEELFSNEESCAQILNQIKLKCEKLSKDNFTAILFKIEDAQIPTFQEDEVHYVEAIPITDFKEPSVSRIEEAEKSVFEGGINKKIILALAILVLAITVFFFLKDIKKVFTEDNRPKKENNESQGKKSGQDADAREPSPEAPKEVEESASDDSDQLEENENNKPGLN
jgi:serine/threonine protein phosphatase PrpC